MATEKKLSANPAATTPPSSRPSLPPQFENRRFHKALLLTGPMITLLLTGLKLSDPAAAGLDIAFHLLARVTYILNVGIVK